MNKPNTNKPGTHRPSTNKSGTNKPGYSVQFNGEAVQPSKIVCIGRNYVAHIAELGNEVPDEMVVFLKPGSAISNVLHSQHLNEPLHYEGELSFMVRNGRFAAVAFGIDLTKRTLQAKLKQKGLPWERAKGFAGAAVFSEFVPLRNGLAKLGFELKINGSAVQVGDISLMMYPPDEIKTELDRFMPLVDGDIVMTGTPAGVGEVHAGAVFSANVFDSGETLLEAQWTAV